MESLRTHSLVLDPNHPGIHDAAYVARREHLYRLGREHRLGRNGIPDIEHTAEEDRTWSYVVARLVEAHRKSACSIYRDGWKQLDLDTDRMPRLRELDAKTRAAAGLSLVPAGRMVPPPDRFAFLPEGCIPCTQYLRHHSRPEYTPEPDAVHDVLGHVPLLMNRDYAEIVIRLGKGAVRSDDAGLVAFSRLYWFTIEFGLIEEHGATQILGDGLLSFFGWL